MQLPRSRGFVVCSSILILSSACGGGNASSLSSGPDPEEVGFFVDPNRGGAAIPPRLIGVSWGRLVDVHDVDAQGRPSGVPVLRDIVINENVLSDGLNYTLETNPISQSTRLLVHRTQGEPDHGNGTFEALVRQAMGNLPVVLPREPTAAPPFSFVARNACLVLRFDDALDDGPLARLHLAEMVRVATGEPATRPFECRVFFDPNHGALIGGEFHSTRVLVDLTVSEVESASHATTLPLNSLGLPASETTERANAVLRIPTREIIGVQTRVLRGLGGLPLDPLAHGPADLQSPTRDVVRALRSGNDQDVNAGYLLDLDLPEIVASWPVQILSAVAVAPGEVRVDLAFTTPCRAAPRRGDIFDTGDRFLEVLEDGDEPDVHGGVARLRARVLGGGPEEDPALLLGGALHRTTFDAQLDVDRACWLSFSPPAMEPPAHGVSSHATVQIGFTEPMEPRRLSALEGFQIVRGAPETPSARSIVVGTTSLSPDGRQVAFSPVLPLASRTGTHTVNLADVSDLAGNALRQRPGSIAFHVLADDALDPSRGIVLRFERGDEVGPSDHRDLRGQFFYDLEHGTLLPRPVTFASTAADASQPVPAIMVPSPAKPVTPLSPLGSRLQTVWRYADLGWSVRDESQYNIDVVGLSWSPGAATVNSDYFERFEILLGHAGYLPDEYVNPASLLPRYGRSGLSKFFFRDNPLGTQEVVHPRELGYRIDPADVFVGSSGTRLMPWPLNRAGGARTTYTWRDTAILEEGAPFGAGVPMAIEVYPPLQLDNEPGSFAEKGEVPSVGLPLLMEFRCFPTSMAFGQNGLDVLLAVNSSWTPNFRAYSTGGVNTAGVVVQVNPDDEPRPMGGFNPQTGQRTNRGDNTFYIGQLDYVIRVSRVHTAWLDTRSKDPRYLPVVTESHARPAGTEIRFHYRGADAFEVADSRPFDARNLDAYGDLADGGVRFHDGVSTWTEDITDIDGSRYVQVRITFVNDVESGTHPDLSALGIPFTGPRSPGAIDRAPGQASL